jgi:gamma-glutamyltranspeptidase/glutathione hydrolase
MRRLGLVLAMTMAVTVDAGAQRTAKPPLHGRHWMAITGKPLGATAGAAMFSAAGTRWTPRRDVSRRRWTSSRRRTQALIWHRKRQRSSASTRRVAPSGATAEFYRSRGYRHPPEYGPLAAVTPGTPGGLMVMLAEYGTLGLRDVLAPAIEMADGYPIDAQTANSIELNKRRLKEWPYSPPVMLPHLGQSREAPEAGEVFVQSDLAATLRKLVEAGRLLSGKGKSAGIYAMTGSEDIAAEIARGVQDRAA